MYTGAENCFGVLRAPLPLLAQEDPRGVPSVHVLEGHMDSTNCVQFDDKLLVSGSLDRTVRVWDLLKWDCVHVLQGHTATVWCLQVGVQWSADDVIKDRPPLSRWSAEHKDEFAALVKDL
eukprot:1195853-Prorocentrum_minimum.AAC.7